MRKRPFRWWVLSKSIAFGVSAKMLSRYPEKNLVESYEYLFRWLGAVTRKNAEVPERPLSVRRQRARLYKLFSAARVAPAVLVRKLDRTDPARLKRKAILEEAQDRDGLLDQFLSQGVVKSTCNGIGEVAASFATVHPPPNRAISGAPPIVLIPGISNDLVSVDGLVQEIAYSGRKVVVIGYPDSHMGMVTLTFVEDAERAKGFGAHVAFFRDAIRQVLPGEPLVELWGFSTGGPIVAEMVASDPEFAHTVSRAVLVDPAGVVKQSSLQLAIGLVRDFQTFLKDPRRLAGVGWVVGRHKSTPPEAAGQRELKKRVFQALFARVRQPSPCWYAMRVRGDIVVVSFKSSEVTKCYQVFDGRTPPPNPQMKVIVLKGFHTTPLVESAAVIERVAKA